MPADTIDLDALYDPPAERIERCVLDHLVEVHRRYLQAATFFCLATAGDDGLDASPRGGPPGFVQVLDDKHVVFADWPGNNRIASLRNVQHDDRVAMLFLFPGLELFMRINGRAHLSTAPALLAKLGEGAARLPKLATVVAIDEVLMHCGKAINRARLWDPASKIERGVLPSPGQVLAALKQVEVEQADQFDEMYHHAIRNDLY
jgi:PPOX class probable FMN-dependent enzyme